MLSQICIESKPTDQILSQGLHDNIELYRMMELLSNIPLVTINMIESAAALFGFSMMTFSITMIVLGYIFLKIMIPYNYTQDCYISGSSYKRKDFVNIMRQMKKVGKKLPPPYPNGWFAVAEIFELEDGKIKQVESWGKSLAVFRGDSGKVYAVDAHCPHVGANMAVGGTVRGDCIQCPFHFWRYNGSSGQCVYIPGVDNIPKNAYVKTWEAREMYGMIFVWFSTDNETPTYELSAIKEIADGSWKYMGRSDFIIPCHIQDIPENGADFAHFEATHSGHVMSGKTLPTKKIYDLFSHHEWAGDWSVSKDPHIAVMTLSHCMTLFKHLKMFWAHFITMQVGPGCVLIQGTIQFGRFIIIQTVTPISPLVQQMIHRIYCPIHLKPLANILMWSETNMIHRDVMMWASKKFVDQPIFVKTDKRMKAYRKWFTQFYSEKSVTFEDAIKKMHNGDSLDW